MDKPTQEQIKKFLEGLGFYFIEDRGYDYTLQEWEVHYPDGEWHHAYKTAISELIDLNNLFKYSPSIIVGITFCYYPGGVECEVTYITEAGFDTQKVFIANTEEKGFAEENSRRKSALALFWALWQVKEVMLNKE